MGSISANGSNGHHKFTLTVTENSTSTANNTSSISFSFVLSSLGGGWNWEQWGANITYTVNVNGTKYTGSIANYDGSSNVTLKSGTLSVAHNTDGTKSISYSFSVTDTSGQSYTCGNASASGSMALTTIPRYLSITALNIVSITETSAVVKWSVSNPRDSTYYSFDNGVTWIGSATDGEALASDLKSGTFNILNLTPNKTYSIKIKIKRTDSQLWTESEVKSFTTYNYPYCTSAPSFTIGNTVKIDFYNPLKRSIAWEVLGADNSIIAGNTTTEASYTGINGEGSVNNLYKSIPNAKSGTYKVKVTYGNSVATKTGGTYSIKGNEIPTINSLTYSDSNTAIVAITGNNQHIVQNYSTLVAQVGSATANKGAGGISKYVVECNGITAQGTKAGNYSIGAINSNTNVDLKLTVTDTRGLTASKTLKVTMLAHSTPTAIVTLERLNNYEDETYLTVDGSVSSVNGKNTMTVQYRYKLSGGSYGSFVTIGDKQKITFSLNKNNVYIFNIVVTDAFGASHNKEYTLGKGVFPLFIDTEKNSLGMNTFPRAENVFEIGGRLVEHEKEFSIPTTIGVKTGWYLAMSGEFPYVTSKTFLIAVQQTLGGGTGLLYINMRYENSTLKVQRFEWLAQSGITSANINLTTQGNKFYLYVKTTSNYQQYYLKVLQEKVLGGWNFNQYVMNAPTLEDTVDAPSGVAPADTIQTITNDNGTAIKYPDGTMIVTQQYETTVTSADWVAWGSGYTVPLKTPPNFPVAFVGNAPTVTQTLEAKNSNGMLSTRMESTSFSTLNRAGSCQVFRPATGYDGTFKINVMAIGRWR